MKANVPSLFPNEEVAASVIEYAANKSSLLPEPLLQYHEKIINLEHSMMSISTFQGQAMSFLAKTAGAKRILEIGVFRGFSSMVWSNAVGPDGIVTGLEVSPEYAEHSRQVFAEAGIQNVTVLVGDGLETLAALDPEVPYDFIFIDAQKSGYPQYLKTIMAKSVPGAPRRLLRKGGLIVADNVLRRGLVADASPKNPASAQLAEEEAKGRNHTADLVALDEFNTAMREDPRIDAWLMPLFDGVALGRLVD